jgi:hypothetical protein
MADWGVLAIRMARMAKTIPAISNTTEIVA